MAEKRVLHVIANMRHGGVQSWVMDLMRKGQTAGIAMDILAYADQPWPYTAEVEKLGGHIFACTHHRNPVALYRAMRRVQQERGPYAAVHAHEMSHNGIVLAIAWVLGVPVRVSHSHNSAIVGYESWKRRLYNRVMTGLIHVFGTHLLAVSDMAGQKLYGRHWQHDVRDGVVSCGLDFSPFSAQTNAGEMRKEWNIPAGAKVLGHVGRFTYQKNHAFLLEAFAHVVKARPDTRLMLVGKGELEAEVQAQIQRLNLQENVIVTGPRNDVPRLMRGCFDAFVLPSRFEGLGLVILEAMAAGLPCLISDVVPPEAEVVKPLVHRLPLEAGAETWAKTLVELLEKTPPVTKEEALRQIQGSPFTVEKSLDQMAAIYRGEDFDLNACKPTTKV